MYHTTFRVPPDQVLVDIATYVTETEINSELAYETARYCLMDALGCALLALNFPECTRHLGPIVPGTKVPYGVHVPGTDFLLDPVKAAFDIGTVIRWLDYNDTWLAAEWGHPSDNLGAILAAADYISQKRGAENGVPLSMKDVLTALIKAYEIQGVLALENAFNRLGLDHVILVKVASTAVVTHLLGGNKTDIINALSQAFVDGQSLRTYRHAPNTGSRKSWAAGDACSRAVRLAMLTLNGEMGYPSALTAPKWGFYDTTLRGDILKIKRSYGSYVVENILFKIAYPAEFHAQTAVEAAFQLHPICQARLADIAQITITTQEPAMRIINKTGLLHNHADRDHCLQYMVAIGLLFGKLQAEDYADSIAMDPRIDDLRAKMIVVEDPQMTRDYYDPDKRAIPNAIQISFNDGSQTEQVQIDYPLGHKLRRVEGIPRLIAKAEHNFANLPEGKRGALLSLLKDESRLYATSVDEFCRLYGVS